MINKIYVSLTLFYVVLDFISFEFQFCHRRLLNWHATYCILLISFPISKHFMHLLRIKGNFEEDPQVSCIFKKNKREEVTKWRNHSILSIIVATVDVAILEKTHSLLVFLRKMKEKKFIISYQMYMNYYIYLKDYNPLTDTFHSICTFSVNRHIFIQ